MIDEGTPLPYEIEVAAGAIAIRVDKFLNFFVNDVRYNVNY